MALFRRRSAASEVPADADAVASDEAVPQEAAADEPAGFDRSAGPFDESELDRADPALPRLDLGALRIPTMPGVGIQVDGDPSTRVVHVVTLIAGEAGVQLQALAAPRSEGLWDEVRAETLAELHAASGVRVTEDVGAFGPELRAVLPARSPQGAAGTQPVRFTGIDGPRWLLRAAFLGRAATHPDPQDALHAMVRQTIVVRGGEAMAPGDALPLRLPEQPPAGLEVEEDAEDDTGRFSDLDPFERGPEITEVR